MANLSNTFARQFGFDRPEFAINPLSLSISDKQLEAEFLNDLYRRSLRIVQISLGLGIFLYAVFAILDLWIIGHGIHEVWFIRFAVVCPTLAIILLLSFTKHFQSIMQLALCVTMLLSGLAVIAMTAIIDSPGNYLYYAGLIDVIIYCSCIMRLRFKYAASLAWILFAAYQITAIFISQIPLWALVNNNFFLVTAIFIGMFAAYTQELYLRRSFLDERLLRQEKARSEQLLEEANAASEAKSNFLAMISHELRTPLNAVIGFSEIMKCQMFGPLGQERYVTYADDIYHSGVHLLEIINSILDLTKAEAGKLELNEEFVDVQATIANSVRLIAERAAQVGVSVEVVPRDELPMLRADRRMVTQIILNLLSNAVNFSNRGGRVRIDTHLASDGCYEMSFEDSGVGISAEDTARVMEPFVQADSRLSRCHEGTGLGLPLAKKMLELHGGGLELRSALKVGTTAIARFPPERVCLDSRESPRAGRIAV